jgi:hypothetical protein
MYTVSVKFSRKKIMMLSKTKIPDNMMLSNNMLSYFSPLKTRTPHYVKRDLSVRSVFRVSDGSPAARYAVYTQLSRVKYSLIIWSNLVSSRSNRWV